MGSGPSPSPSPWWRTPEAVALLARVSRGLDEPLRLQLLAALAASEQNVATLARLIGRSQPQVSKHLAVLRALGLVEYRRQGNQRFYRFAAHDPAAQAVRTLLVELTRGVPGSDGG